MACIIENIGALMNTCIEVSRRQDINSYLEKMLGGNERQIATQGTSQSKRAKARTVLKAGRNSRRLIFENMCDE